MLTNHVLDLTYSEVRYTVADVVLERDCFTKCTQLKCEWVQADKGGNGQQDRTLCVLLEVSSFVFQAAEGYLCQASARVMALQQTQLLWSYGKWWRGLLVTSVYGPGPTFTLSSHSFQQALWTIVASQWHNHLGSFTVHTVIGRSCGLSSKWFIWTRRWQCWTSSVL